VKSRNYSQYTKQVLPSVDIRKPCDSATIKRTYTLMDTHGVHSVLTSLSHYLFMYYE